MFDCIIIGGGAAGLFSAGLFSVKYKVALVDKNKSPGKKLLITGKGRCNLTNNCDRDVFFSNIHTNPGFLYSSYSFLTPQQTMEYFEGLGVPLKTERGNRVFPQSDKSSDVVSALYKKAIEAGVKFINSVVLSIKKTESVFSVFLSDGGVIESKNVLLCTGGKSYPVTGSDGSGYSLAIGLGHTVTPLKPSLVPVEVLEKELCKSLQGLSLKNTGLKLIRNGKIIFRDFGEMLFTHFGVSGPMILSMSAYAEKNDIISLDLKPALSEKQLDNRILSDFGKYLNKNLDNALADLLPSKLIIPFVELVGADRFCKVNVIGRDLRLRMVRLLKDFRITAEALRPIEEAIITCGGVSVKEINPKNMMSKITPGLFFAGEIIDTDAYTGGFNLQIAFSTAYTAVNGIMSQSD